MNPVGEFLLNLLHHDIKSVVEVEAAHERLMDFTGNAVIQVIFCGIEAIAEVVSVSHHGRK